MSLPNPQSPTHAAPRITAARFKQLLAGKNSPAVPEAVDVFEILDARNVDPSFALAQFRVESQYGTSGIAKTTHSWGNMLYDANLTVRSGDPYSSGNGYTYATYDSYLDAIHDYCDYLDYYEDEKNCPDIWRATWRWLGPNKPIDNPGHVSYVNIVLNDMVIAEFPAGTFYDSGDDMIYAGASVGKDATGHIDGSLKLRYPLNKGDRLYRGPGLDTYLKTYDGTSGKAWYLGLVNGSTKWGAILIGTPVADPDGTVVYIPNIDKTKIIKV